MRALVLILTALSLSACATMSHHDAVVLSTSERAVLVKDCAALLTDSFLPAKTTVCFVCDPKDELATDLQASLREHGFAVLSEPNDQSKKTYIQVISVGPDGVLLRLNVSADWGADRLYHRDATGLLPESGFTVRNGDTQNG
jgi:hypothetical protein